MREGREALTLHGEEVVQVAIASQVQLQVFLVHFCVLFLLTFNNFFNYTFSTSFSCQNVRRSKLLMSTPKHTVVSCIRHFVNFDFSRPPFGSKTANAGDSGWQDTMIDDLLSRASCGAGGPGFLVEPTGTWCFGVGFARFLLGSGRCGLN